MIKTSIPVKVAIGYGLVIVVLALATWLVYTNTHSLLAVQQASREYVQKRWVADNLVHSLMETNNSERSVNIGVTDNWTAFNKSLNNAQNLTRQLQDLETDSLQRARMDTLIDLLGQRRKNLIAVMKVLADEHHDTALRQKVKRLQSGQDSVVVHQQTTQTHEAKERTVEVVKTRRGFFHRLADAFHKEHTDTVNITVTHPKTDIDTVKQAFNVGDTVAHVLQQINHANQQANKNRENRLSQRLQQLQLVVIKIAQRTDQLLDDIRQGERLSLNAALQHDMQARSSILYKVVLLGVVATIIALVFLLYAWEDNRRERRYRESLEQAQAETSRIMQQRERLLLTITHDIKAPAASISGFIDLLKGQVDTEKGLSYLNNIGQSAKHLLQLVSALLDYHQLEEKKIELRPVSFSPGSLIDTCVTSMRPQAVAKGLQIESHTEGVGNVMCRADAFRLRQVLDNLVSNAIKYTSKGQVAVTASLQHQRLYISVSDTGEGMSPSECQRVFGAFTRLANAQGTEGVELGLSITRELVGLLKGTVVIHSTKGKGSTFEVAIPVELCTDASALTTSPAETVTAVETTEEATRERFRTELSVAIIDDDPLQLQLLAELLRRSAQPLFHVTTCQHVSQLQHFLHTTTPDYLIMDIEMPETNGIDLLHAIPHNGIHTIAMTAHDRSIEPDLLKAGFEAVLYKPFSKESLYKLFTVNGGLLCPPQSSHDEPSCQNTQFASLLAFAEGDKEAEREILNNIHTELTTHLAHLRRACTTTPDRTLIAHTAHKLLPVLTMTDTDCHEELVLLSPEHIERLTDQQVKSCCQKVEKNLVKLLQEI